MWLDDFQILSLIALGETAATLDAEIYEAEDSGVSVNANLVFKGKLLGSFVGKKFKGKVRAFSGKLGHEFPSFNLSRTCNFNLFDHGCQRLKGAAMDPGPWECSGNFSAWDGNFNSLFLDNFALSANLPAISQGAGDPASGTGAVGDYYVNTTSGIIWHKRTSSEWVQDDFFRGGWVVTGIGLERQVRGVSMSFYFPTWATPQIHLRLDKALRTGIITPGQPCAFYPGCNGNINTCQHKFDNMDNFGGFPYAPSWIEEKPRTVGGGVGK